MQYQQAVVHKHSVLSAFAIVFTNQIISMVEYRIQRKLYSATNRRKERK